MPIHSLQQLPTRPILRQRIRRRPQTIQPILPILIRLKLSTQVVIALVLRVLEIVLPIAARLPHVEGHVGDGLLGYEVFDLAVHVGDGALMCVLDDGVTELAPRGVGGPEGAEDCGGGGDIGFVFGLDVVCDFGHETAYVVSFVRLEVGL